MTREELNYLKADLLRKQSARARAGDGYTKNLAEIQKRLDEIEKELEKLDG